MTLTIHLPEPVERRLADRAAREGKAVEAVVAELIERSLPAEKTMAEVMAPLAAESAASGMTEAEFDALIEDAREEVWREKHGTPSKRP